MDYKRRLIVKKTPKHILLKEGSNKKIKELLERERESERLIKNKEIEYGNKKLFGEGG